MKIEIPNNNDEKNMTWSMFLKGLVKEGISIILVLGWMTMPYIEHLFKVQFDKAYKDSASWAFWFSLYYHFGEKAFQFLSFYLGNYKVIKMDKEESEEKSDNHNLN